MKREGRRNESGGLTLGHTNSVDDAEASTEDRDREKREVRILNKGRRSAFEQIVLCDRHREEPSLGRERNEREESTTLPLANDAVRAEWCKREPARTDDEA